MPDLTIDHILDALGHAHQRATYGAVAATIGCSPRMLMKGRERDQRHSWVVNRRSGEPTGYDPEQLHPDLHERPDVLQTKEQLIAWVASSSTRASREPSYA